MDDNLINLLAANQIIFWLKAPVRPFRVLLQTAEHGNADDEQTDNTMVTRATLNAEIPSGT